MYKGGPLPTPIPLWPVPSFRKKEMTMMLTPPSPPPSSGQGGELDPRILAGPAFALDLRTLPQASLSSSSLKEYLWTFSAFALTLVSLPGPLPTPPSRSKAFCLSFLPFYMCSQASCKYICRALRQHWLSPSEIKRWIMSLTPKFSRGVIHPASPLPNHHHLNKSQKALFSSIR